MDDIPVGRGKTVEVDGDTAICPWHGFDFDLSTGACRVDPALSVTVYPTRVEGTDLLVELP